MENVKGMFSRKYGGVPAWLILLVAVGGAYLYMRHTGSSLFGGGSSSTDPNADTAGSATPGDGGTPSIVYVQQPPATNGPSTNPNHPHHPAGPPPTHKVTTAQRASAIMADFRKHGLAYFTNHPSALTWLKANAPGDYRVVQAAQKGKKVTPTSRPGASKNPPKQGGPARRTPKSPKVRG